jgi:dynein heavy chain 1
MIWFSEHVLTLDMIYENYFGRLCNVPLEGGEDNEELTALSLKASAASDMKLARSLSQPSTPAALDSLPPEFPNPAGQSTINNPELLSILNEQRQLAAHLRPYFTADSLVTKCLEYASVKFEHIMDFTRLRALGSMFTMLNQAVRSVLSYNQTHDFRLSDDVAEKYVTKSLVLAILWSFSGDCKLKYRIELGEFLRTSVYITMPPATSGHGGQQVPIIDYEVSLNTGEWVPWLAKVPQIEVETHKVAAPDVVVPTVDTIRHESLLFTWLS